jgi:hypothetical protein
MRGYLDAQLAGFDLVPDAATKAHPMTKADHPGARPA